MIEEVKKALENIRRIKKIDSNGVCNFAEFVLSDEDAAQQICQLFPKTPDNPDGYEGCEYCKGEGYLPDDDTGEPNHPVGGIRCPICLGEGDS